MKQNEADKLTSQSRVRHKRYGAATVKEAVSGLGVVITPATEEGLKMLHCDCGAIIDDLMCEARELTELNTEISGCEPTDKTQH